MRARQYLSQVKAYKQIIAHKRKQRAELHDDISFIRGLDYSRDRVQASPGEGMVGVAIKLADFDLELCNTIEEYSRKIDEIINRIHSLDNSLYVECLYQFYVEGKTLDAISFDLGYSYSSLAHAHGDALRAFEKANPDIANLT